MGGADAIRDEYARFLTTPNRHVVRKAMEALSVDVGGVINVLRSDEGARTFKPAIGAIEGAACGRVAGGQLGAEGST